MTQIVPDVYRITPPGTLSTSGKSEMSGTRCTEAATNRTRLARRGNDPSVYASAMRENLKEARKWQSRYTARRFSSTFIICLSTRKRWILQLILPRNYIIRHPRIFGKCVINKAYKLDLTKLMKIHDITHYVMTIQKSSSRWRIIRHSVNQRYIIISNEWRKVYTLFKIKLDHCSCQNRTLVSLSKCCSDQPHVRSTARGMYIQRILMASGRRRITWKMGNGQMVAVLAGYARFISPSIRLLL